MNDFGQRLTQLKAQIPEHVRIVAVSKTKPVCMLRTAYAAGQRIFGENKVQEILNKYPEMPSDVEWHMIGHLQTNKVKLLIPHVSMIHSIDSVKLLNTVQKEAAKIQQVVSCLIQIHIATEETKFGFALDEAIELFEKLVPQDYPNIRFSGLMGMASFVQDEHEVLSEFKSLKNLFDKIKMTSMSGHSDFKEISMGMSGDYPLAVKEGSTLIRVGTLLFGGR